MHGMKWHRAGLCSLPLFSSLSSSLLLLSLVFISGGSKLAHAQADGFISIDCGASRGNVSGNLSWTTDSSYTVLGENAETSAPFPYNTLRYFPDSTITKSCYVFNTTANFSYLIRAGFLYGNYDNLSSTEGTPSFVLLFGPNVWTDVEFNEDLEVVTHEIIILASSDTESVCLARSRTANHNPFLSSLEIRPLSSNQMMYSPVHQRFLMKSNSRIDFGNNGNSPVRFPDDVYDRIWVPDSEAITNISFYNTIVATNNTVSAVRLTYDLPPSKVMQTARSPNNTGNMSFAFTARFGPGQYYLALYFADILNNSQQRIMDVYIDGSLSYQALNLFDTNRSYEALELFYENYTVSDGDYRLLLMPTENSTAAPIINAAESYFLQRINGSTADHDVQALEMIKLSFNLSKWMGDPCTPYTYKWPWLDCDTIDSLTRVIALNLSNLSLRNEIPPALGDLSALTTVDLYNNALYGSIPSSLANLSSLKFLDLSFNNLSGEYPLELNQLDFRFAGNPFLCVNNSCDNASGPESAVTQSARPVGLIVGLVIGSLAVLVAVILMCVLYKHQSQKRKRLFLTHSEHWPPVPPFTEISKSVNSRAVVHGEGCHDVPVYSLVDMQSITNNFGNKIVDGSKGSLYYGNFPDGQEVLVRLLESDIKLTPMEFLYKVTPLSYVNHRHVLRPIAFCAEPHHFMFIYEGAQTGTLYNYLHGKSSLDWRTRLNILQQVAQGLEHLHSLSIVHGNLKSGNVLLSGDGLLAKVSDFGMYELSSDRYTTSHYLDPEDLAMKKLREKNDIHNFGVLILEVVCGRKPSDQSLSKDARNIVDWVCKMYKGGEEDLIADAALRGNYKNSILLKIIKLALEATANTVDDRPSMTDLVLELKEAHKIEIGHHVAFAELDNVNTSDDLEAPLTSFNVNTSDDAEAPLTSFNGRA